MREFVHAVSLPVPCNVCHILFRHSIFERGAGTVLPKKTQDRNHLCSAQKSFGSASFERATRSICVYVGVSHFRFVSVYLCVTCVFDSMNHYTLLCNEVIGEAHRRQRARVKIRHDSTRISLSSRLHTPTTADSIVLTLRRTLQCPIS